MSSKFLPAHLALHSFHAVLPLPTQMCGRRRPVDAIWIENMNTVLDDNKKLCLVSGEIIQLSPTMTMMFEVEDLAVASPATVSRCGMVYMEPSALGLRPLADSCLQALPPRFTAATRDLLLRLFEALVPPLVTFVRKFLQETVTTVDGNLCIGCFRIFSALACREGAEEEGVAAEARSQALAAPLFVFAVVWSVGGSCDKASRPLFDQELRQRLATSGCALCADVFVMPICLLMPFRSEPASLHFRLSPTPSP